MSYWFRCIFSVLGLLISLFSFTNCSGDATFVTRWEVPDSCVLSFPAQGKLRFRWRLMGEEFGEWEETEIKHGEVLGIALNSAGVYDIEVHPNGLERFQMVIGDDLLHEKTLLYDSLYVVGSNDYLREVVRWGDVKWHSMRLAFATCASLHIAPDAGVPNLSDCEDCAAIFYKCSDLDADLHTWKVKNVKIWTDAFSFCPKMSAERQPLFQ